MIFTRNLGILHIKSHGEPAYATTVAYTITVKSVYKSMLLISADYKLILSYLNVKQWVKMNLCI